MFDDYERLKGFLYEKIALRKKRIHPEHSRRFNHDMQLEIDCYEWVLGKIEVNKIPFDRLEHVILFIVYLTLRSIIFELVYGLIPCPYG